MPARGTVPGLSVAAATVAAASEHAGAAAAQAGTELSLALTHGGCGFYRRSVLLRDLHCPHEQVTLTVDTMVDGGDLACELPAEGDSGNPNPNPNPHQTYRGYVAVSLAAESAEQLRSWKVRPRH